MKMKLTFTELSSFKFSNFRQLSCTVEYGDFLHYRLWKLCNKLLPQFSMDHFQTLYTCACWSDIINVLAAF